MSAEPDAVPALVIRCGESPDVSVRLSDRVFPDQYGVCFMAEVAAQGLSARVDEVAVWVWDHEPDLGQFLTGLAADFRGWDGERVWRNNHLTVRAEFRSRGHVALTWTLREFSSLPDGWEASVTTVLEAGEQLTRVAADVAEFLRLEAPGR